jgi:hypothetical protein
VAKRKVSDDCRRPGRVQALGVGLAAGTNRAVADVDVANALAQGRRVQQGLHHGGKVQQGLHQASVVGWMFAELFTCQ